MSKAKLYHRSLIDAYELDFQHDGQRLSSFIYWETEQNVLGVIVFSDVVYLFERKLDKSDRKVFMGNLADTLLNAKWTVGFKEKLFKIAEFDGKSVEISYQEQTLSLPLINDQKLFDERRREIINIYLRDIKELNTVIDDVREKSTPKKTVPHQVTMQKAMFGRRRPNPVGGPSSSAKVPKQEQDD